LYLIANDYRKTIQDQNLAQITQSSLAIRQDAEMTALDECISYLTQKYDVLAEFTDTNVYDPTITHGAADRVYLDAPAYLPSSTYAIGALTLNGGNVYICSTAITVPEAFNAAHWTLLGAQNSIFYAVFPYPVFDLTQVYAVGDKVFWHGHTYSCIQATVIFDHDTYLQFANTNNVPLSNIFPDDTVNGSKNWTDLGAYVVPAGSLLNATYFKAGDNRSKKIVKTMVDISLFYLHQAAGSRVVPDSRHAAYLQAIRWLEMTAEGKITSSVTRIQPQSGSSILYGSNIKNVNGY